MRVLRSVRRESVESADFKCTPAKLPDREWLELGLVFFWALVPMEVIVEADHWWCTGVSVRRSEKLPPERNEELTPRF